MAQQEQIDFLCEQVNEISARARRTETTLHKVSEHLNIVKDDSDKIAVIGRNEVKVGDYNVTLSQIKRALEGAGNSEMLDTITVTGRNGLIATITFRG